MKVKTIKTQFKKEFGLTLRVYDGRSFADDDVTLASIRKGESKGGELTPRNNIKVGNLENKINEMFGIKVQISGSDDSYLCDNNLTLKGAREEDSKKLERKKRKKGKDDIELPDYFTSLFDANGNPVSVIVYDEATDDMLEYSKIYVDILQQEYPNYYEILDVMYDFYGHLFNKPEAFLKIGQIDIELVSYQKEEEIEDGAVYIAHNRVYKFTFNSGEEVTVRFSITNDSEGELVEEDKELISILDSWGDEIDLEDVDYLGGPSQYIHDGEEPHEDEWLKDLCSFMDSSLDVQKYFYETSDTYRQFIRKYYYNLPNNEKLVLDAVKENANDLRFALDVFKDNKKVVLEAVKQDGSAIEYASERLQDDEEVVLEAVKQAGHAIKYANYRFRQDRKVMLTVVQTFGCGLQYASDDLRDDKNLVLEALKNNSYALQYASERLRDELESED